MQTFQPPSDEEIGAAFAEGQAAVAALIRRALRQQAALFESGAEAAGRQREILQGELYWVALEEDGVAHPQVVLQENVFNRSRIPSVVVCGLTSNRKRASAPGNVLLEDGEGNLTRQSVVEVSKVSTVAKTRLGEYIGALSAARVEQILAGMRFLQAISEPRDAGG
jgi:mRNA interferase MazF